MSESDRRSWALNIAEWGMDGILDGWSGSEWRDDRSKVTRSTGVTPRVCPAEL